MGQASAARTRSISHLSITVRDIGEATAFYREFLQQEPIGTWEADGGNSFLDAVLGYDETRMREVMFPLGDGYLELLEYQHPQGGEVDPETFLVGHVHVCLVVDDVGAEYRRLQDADIGVEFRGDGPSVVPASDPDFGGYEYVYLRTPDGATFELTNKKPS